MFLTSLRRHGPAHTWASTRWGLASPSPLVHSWAWQRWRDLVLAQCGLELSSVGASRRQCCGTCEREIVSSLEQARVELQPKKRRAASPETERSFSNASLFVHWFFTDCLSRDFELPNLYDGFAAGRRTSR